MLDEYDGSCQCPDALLSHPCFITGDTSAGSLAWQIATAIRRAPPGRPGADGSLAPRTHPNQTLPEIKAAVLRVRLGVPELGLEEDPLELDRRAT